MKYDTIVRRIISRLSELFLNIDNENV